MGRKSGAFGAMLANMILSGNVGFDSGLATHGRRGRSYGPGVAAWQLTDPENPSDWELHLRVKGTKGLVKMSFKNVPYSHVKAQLPAGTKSFRVKSRVVREVAHVDAVGS